MLAVLRGIWYNDLIMERELTADQENAKKLITEWFLNTDNRVFVLAGYAGTGKTFLINHVVQDVLHLKAGSEAVFVTPTGKAATVLIKNGTVAGTVHSLIYTRDEDDFDVDENGRSGGKGNAVVYEKGKDRRENPPDYRGRSVHDRRGRLAGFVEL